MTNNQLITLVEIFNNRIFRIPDYQRGYSWKQPQLEDFWGDLQNLKDGQHHYTGLLTVENIQTARMTNSEKWQDDLWMFSKGFKAYHVIDGQQRLTTIIILLTTIFNRFQDDEMVNYEARVDLTKRFLYQQAGQYKSYIFGYEKDDPSNEYFKTKILDQHSSKAYGVPEQTLYTANLIAARQFFEQKTESLSKPELEALYRKIVTGLKFNFYEIDDDLDVFVAFEVMNNRGKPLSTLELLKNRLIYLSTLLTAPDDDKVKLRKDITETWKTVYEYLGKNKDNPLDDDDFLRNHWIMYFKYDRDEAGAFNNFLLKKYFTSQNVLDPSSQQQVGFEEIKRYVDSLAASVKMWFYLRNSQCSTFPDEIREWLNKLNRIGFGAFAPLIMAALVKNVGQQDLVELLKLCERAVFLVFRISRRLSNTKNNHFYRVANNLYYNNISALEAMEEIRLFIDGNDNYYGWYDLSRFVDYIEEQFKNEEGFYSWNGLKYLLYEYELHLQKKEQSKVSWETVKNNNTIEHIYPQEAQDKCWIDKFAGWSQKKYILHSLGNLVLLPQAKNAAIQNKCFLYKKTHQDKSGNQTGYFNGSYSEIEVAQYADWTPKEILQRGIKLLEFMEKRWDIKINDKEKLLCWKAKK